MLPENEGEASANILKDTVIPLVGISTPSSINGSNEGSYSLSGTCESGGGSVSVSLGSLATTTITCFSNGQWSVSDIDASTLGEGSITLEVTQSDVAGNEGEASANILKDTATPLVGISTPSSINGPNEGSYSLSGTCESGSGSVSVTLGSLATNTLTCSSNGQWDINNIDTSTLAEGTITLEVIQFDVAGNEGEVIVNILKDTTTPLIGISTPSSINGSNEGSYSFSGTCESGGGSVSVTLGSLATSTLTCSSNGQWDVNNVDTSTLAEGIVTLEVIQSDLAGNEGEASANILKDTIAPLVGISTPSSINGSNENSYSFSGTCESGGGSVSVTLGSLATSTLTCTSNGQWDVNNIDTSTLAEGSITLEVIQSDVAGNEGEASVNIFKDTAIPLVGISTPSSINGSNENSYSLSGTCENGGGSVSVTLGSLSTSTFTCASNGQWSASNIDASTLGDGSITLDVTQSDSFGNEGEASANILKDTVTPSVGISLPSSINGSNEGSYSLSGTCESGSGSVSITLGSLATTTLACASNGQWSVSNIDASTLGEESITLEVTQSDVAGNEGEASTNILKDTVIPSVGISTPSSINGSNESSYSLSGTCESGSGSVSVSLENLNTITLACASNGQWSVSGIDVSTLGEGSITLDVTQSDVAGNEGEASANILKDTVTPSVGISTPSSINGSNESSYSLSGTCESGGGSVSVTLESLSTSTLTCTSNGQWSASDIDASTLGEGNVTLEVTQSDSVGNEGEASANILKDTVTPSVGISTPSFINGSNESSYSLSGTCESGGDSVSVTLGSLSTSTLTCDANGQWSASDIDASTLGEGNVTLEVTQSDSAGNEGEASASILKDTVTPSVGISTPSFINGSNESSYSLSGNL